MRAGKKMYFFSFVFETFWWFCRRLQNIVFSWNPFKLCSTSDVRVQQPFRNSVKFFPAWISLQNIFSGFFWRDINFECRVSKKIFLILKHCTSDKAFCAIRLHKAFVDALAKFWVETRVEVQKNLPLQKVTLCTDVCGPPLNYCGCSCAVSLLRKHTGEVSASKTLSNSQKWIFSEFSPKKSWLFELRRLFQKDVSAQILNSFCPKWGFPRSITSQLISHSLGAPILSSFDFFGIFFGKTSGFC